MSTRRFYVAILLAVPLLALPLAATPAGRGRGGEQAIATAQVDGTTLSVTAQMAHHGAVLRVSGPDGYALTKRSPGGAAVFADLLAEAGRGISVLPDGLYHYEVVFTEAVGEPRLHTGAFFVQGGVAVSRNAKRAQLGSTRQTLLAESDRQARTETESIRQPGGEGYTAIQYIVIDDNGFYYNTGLDLESYAYFYPYYYPTMGLVNDRGVLRMRTNDTGYSGNPYGGTYHLSILSSSGNVGIGTTAPQKKLHVQTTTIFDGIQLGNDAGSGFTTTWNFAVDGFAGLTIQDAENGNAGVFRLREGAPAESLVVAANGSKGMGTASPDATLHVVEDDDAKHARVNVRVTGSDFAPQFEYEDGSSGAIWREGMNNAGDFVINQTDDLGVAEMLIKPDGRVIVNGTQVHPDYVFDSGYELMDLSELARFVEENGHLPGVISSEDADGKVDLSSFPLQLLEKIEELTLYAIDQERRFLEKDAEMAALRAEVEALKASLATR